jgi:hypothetical protein
MENILAGGNIPPSICFSPKLLYGLLGQASYSGYVLTAVRGIYLWFEYINITYIIVKLTSKFIDSY